jgi:hypothetical protein
VFQIIENYDHLKKHAKLVWRHFIDTPDTTPIRQNKPKMPMFAVDYPILAKCIVTNGNYMPYSQRVQQECFSVVFCSKQEAKRIVYPKTNKNRSTALLRVDPFIFAHNESDIDSYVEESFKLNAERVDRTSDTQRQIMTIFRAYVGEMAADAYPCLIKNRRHYSGARMVLSFHVVTRPAAKSLVYYGKHSRIGWALNKPTAYSPPTVHGQLKNGEYRFRISYEYPIPTITISADLSKGRVMRFKQNVEKLIHDGELSKIDNINKDIANRMDIEYNINGNTFTTNQLIEVAKMAVDTFCTWRSTYRHELGVGEQMLDEDLSERTTPESGTTANPSRLYISASRCYELHPEEPDAVEPDAVDDSRVYSEGGRTNDTPADLAEETADRAKKRKQNMGFSAVGLIQTRETEVE